MRAIAFTVGVLVCLTCQCGPAVAGTTADALEVLCPGHENLAPMVDGSARKYMHHPVTLVALMAVESHCQAGAISRKGAVCEMQLLGVARNGHTRAELQGDSRLCIATGARWLAMMEVWAGSLAGGLGAYNTGKRGHGAGFARLVLAKVAKVWRELQRRREPRS